MPFIGIISKESDSNFIKNGVLKNSEHTKFVFLNINISNIENIRNIRFETIIINDDYIDFLKKSKYLEEIIDKAKYYIINSDIVNNIDFNGKKIIKYGLKHDSDITISSINNENILMCVQKSFTTINETIIEEQEKCIQMAKINRKKICNSMAIFAILTIYGEKLKKI